MKLHRSPSRAHAFTLIELLVVVGVIALLIAILVPTLGRAKETARRTVCASNLKSIGYGINVFAFENSDRILPFSRDTKDNTRFLFSWANVSGYEPYYAPWTTFSAYFEPGGTQGPINLALLYDLKLVSDPHTFYCPSAIYVDWIYRTPDYWKVLPPTGATGILAGYNYNPHATAGYPTYTHKNTFPVEKTLAIDMITTWRKTVDVAHSSIPAWNVLFIDGHVDLRKSPEALERVMNGRTGDDWNDMKIALDGLQK